MQAVPEQYEALLAHELSHLHFAQRAGAMTMMRLPNWFTEGWATLTSGGGGAEGVGPEQAIFALVHGHHFTPHDAESLLFPSTAGDFNLSGTMYYRQASLLVDYLQRRDPKAFRGLISNIETVQRFGPSVVNVYGQPLSVLWKDFQVDLRLHSAAKWENRQAPADGITPVMQLDAAVMAVGQISDHRYAKQQKPELFHR